MRAMGHDHEPFLLFFALSESSTPAGDRGEQRRQNELKHLDTTLPGRPPYFDIPGIVTGSRMAASKIVGKSSTVPRRVPRVLLRPKLSQSQFLARTCPHFAVGVIGGSGEQPRLKGGQ